MARRPCAGACVQAQVPFQGACQLQLFCFLAPLAEDWATFEVSLATFAVPQPGWW